MKKKKSAKRISPHTKALFNMVGITETAKGGTMKDIDKLRLRDKALEDAIRLYSGQIRSPEEIVRAADEFYKYITKSKIKKEKRKKGRSKK